MIIATAGHVDHGKTTLIKALTGKNTDQLAEEQRRGMTIDLGFAWLHDNKAGTIGFVDVPGHAGFIRTMLAGLAGVDAALLVIAADEGPMPQTHEHLALLDLLGVNQGIVVMSAVDRADAQQRIDCQCAIQDLLQHSNLLGAPVLEIDALSGYGLPELLDAIQALTLKTPPRCSDGSPRFLIDRRFSVPGSGCVVTGTLLHGRLTLAQQPALHLAPTDRPLRLRAMQMYGQPVSEIRSGQRAALNLVGELDNNHPQRGDWILAAEQCQTSQRLDVQLRVLPGQSIHRGTLQIITGASVSSGRLVWLDETAGLAQLLLDKSLHVIVGDSVIVREPAANCTLAGGRVLDPQGAQRGRSKPQALARLQALSLVDTASKALDVELQHRAELQVTAFSKRWNLGAAQQSTLLAQHAVVTLGDQVLSTERLHDAEALILQTVRQVHAAQPALAGLQQQAVLRLAMTGLSAATGLKLIARLVAHKLLQRRGPLLALPDHQAVLPAQDQAIWQQVHDELAKAALRPPIVGELAEQLGMARDEMLAVMQRLHAWGYVLAVAPNRFYLPPQLDDLISVAQTLCAESPDSGFSTADYRDRSGIGRNLSVKVLEYLDRVGVTYYRAERRFMRSAYQYVPVSTIQG